MKRYNVIITLILLLSISYVRAQQISFYRYGSFTVKGDSIQLDTLSLVYNSLRVYNQSKQLIAQADYRIDYYKARLYWINKPTGDSIRATYTVLPANLTTRYQHKDYNTFQRTDSLIRSNFFYIPPKSSAGILDMGLVNYNGSFARGISFGNQQDVVVNSAFNLQMQGMLPGNIMLSAALTDNNIPIQPEGNTQQLQDFDRVFIQLRKDNNNLTIGDFEIKRPAGYFMNYYKNLQGASVFSSYALNNTFTGNTKASVALVRGKYARNQFTGQEGNQGPYRLQGNNGETFIIVLAGSERVFIDGVLLQRGTDADYIIDYNTGEIRFMPKRLINQFHRISVEFEYTDRSYFRSILTGTQEFTSKKTTYRINIYSEQDAKNQPVFMELDSAKRTILRAVGDSISQAFTQSIDSTGYSTNKILYAKMQDPVYGIYYRYSTNPDSALFTLQFSYVGEKKGNYRIKNTIANGRVYEFIAPQDGIPQGAFEPVVLLIAAQKIQMITASVDQQLKNGSSAGVELALSERDANTFSEKDNRDNSGIALNAYLNERIKLQKNKKDPWVLVSNTRYEFNDKRFRQIENFRTIEFERDWNTVRSNQFFTFHQLMTDLGLRKNDMLFQYTAGFLQRTSQYSGLQQALHILYKKKRWDILARNSLTSTNSTLNRTSFLRPTNQIAFLPGKRKQYRIALNTLYEKNDIRLKQGDTLSGASFFWLQNELLFAKQDTTAFNYSIGVMRRYDLLPFNNRYRYAFHADNISALFTYKHDPNNQVLFNLNYRQIRVADTSLTAQRYDESMTGRMEYNGVIRRGLFSLQSLLQLGSGLEQRLEFVFVEVTQGQGVYAYIGDFNNNGIKDIIEFEISAFPDQANYIKVFVPTNDFVKTFTNQFSQTVNIQPRAVWMKEKGLKKFLTRWYDSFTIQFDNKLRGIQIIEALNPFQFNIADSLLVSNSSILANNLSFNRNSPVYSIDFNSQRNTSKSFLNNGFEARLVENYTLRFRWNLTKTIQIQQELRRDIKQNLSEYFLTRNFNILGYSAEPRITYQTTNNRRLSISYLYRTAQNQNSETAERLKNNRIIMEGRAGMANKSSLNIKVTYARVVYTGAINSPVQFAMLEGLQNGNNVLWSLTWDKRLSKVLEMSLVYDGRKTGTAEMVHIGRAQMRALF